MQWRIVVKDGRIVEVTEVVGVEGSRVLFERYLPLHDTVLKRYRVAVASSDVEAARLVAVPSGRGSGVVVEVFSLTRCTGSQIWTRPFGLVVAAE